MSGPGRLIPLPAVILALILSTIAISQQVRQRSVEDLPSIVKSKSYQRWLWAFRQRAYPGEDIPSRARERALKQVEDLRLAARARQRSAIVQGDRWMSIGPAPILGGQIGDTGNTRPMSGRVADVAVDPRDPAHWLIGAAQGGIWETRDSGLTWQPKTDDGKSLAFGAIAFAPSDPMVIYAGMGEAAFSGDVYGGYGMLKSNNGGESWNLIGESSFRGVGFSDIKVDPANPDIVVVAVTRSFFGRGRNLDPNFTLPGIYRTANGGVTWSRMLNISATDATDLEVDPGNFKNQYAAISDPASSDPLNGIYRSTDAGLTWARISAPWNSAQAGRIELAIAPSSPNVLYVSIQRTETLDWLGIWRTDNAWDGGSQGVSLNPIPLHPSMLPAAGFERQLHFDHELSVDPLDPNTLYAGGVYLWKCRPCSPGGAVWTEVSHALNDPAHGINADPKVGIHVDQHSMAWVNRERTAASLSMRPMIFEPNVGQTDSRVAFLARGSGYGLFLTGNEAVMSLEGRREGSSGTLRMSLIGADSGASITGLDRTPNHSNYFLGRDRRAWKTGVANYARVKYENPWPGIDLVYYGNQRQLEYDFIVAPGARPSRIRIGVDGVKGMYISKAGDLVMRTLDGAVRMLKPHIYQIIDGERKVVSGRYLRRGWREIGFRIDKYDRSEPLIIDPILAYSTYFGGSGEDVGGGIAVDAGGHAYVTGVTQSVDFPLKSPVFSGYKGSKDIFIVKLNPAGDIPVYSTYFGGVNEENSPSIAIDKNGNAYVSGQTKSPDLPVTAGAFDTKCGTDGTCERYSNLQADGFALKLNQAGNALVYSTYIGGDSTDVVYKIAVDDNGNAYLAGQSDSTDDPATPGFEGFPTTSGAYKSRPCDSFSCKFDAFIAKLNPTGTGLVFSTLLGGAGNESASGLAFDKDGNVFLTGSTQSADFPTTPGAYDRTCGTDGKCNIPDPPPVVIITDDAFVAKMNGTGSGLIYSTFLGGKDWDSIGLQEIAIDDQGYAYIAGTTASTDFPTTPGSFQPLPGSPADVYAVKLNQQGTGLVWSTYIGGDSADLSASMTLGPGGTIHLVGMTASTNFPLVNPIQNVRGGGQLDGFVTILKADGSGLSFSTWLGGTGDDAVTGIALDAGGSAYIVGSTGSADFPIVAGAYQPTFKGQLDSFIARIAEGGWSLVVGNDGGVWSTSNGGDSWQVHNTNLSITQFYDGSLHPLKPDHALGGSQDNGTSLWSGASGWRWVGPGDGAASAFSSSRPDTHWMVSAQYLSIDRTTDGGATLEHADSGIDKSNAPFIARCEKCPSNENILIAGGRALWKSSNFFGADDPTWTANSQDLGEAISAIAFSSRDGSCGTYAFGTEKGLLRLTINGGQSWTDLDPSNLVPGRYVTDLVFDPNNDNVLYVTLSGFNERTPSQPGHVFRTATALSGNPQWANVSTGVNIPHNTIALDQAFPDIVYVGTDIGIWRSTNGGSLWENMGPESGMPNVAVFDLQVNESTNRLIAFTHGRGAFVLTNSAAADLGVTITHTPQLIGLYRELTWNILVTNFGPSPASGVFLTETLPDGVELISLPPGCQGTRTVICNLGGVAAGTTRTVSIVVKANRAGLIINRATVTSLNQDPNPMNNETDELLDVYGPPVISRISPSSAGQGAGNLEIRIEGSNFLPGAEVTIVPGTGIELLPEVPPGSGLISTGEIRRRINIAADAPLIQHEIFVTNIGGLKGGSGPANLFSVIPLAPTISTVSPQDGPTGTIVTINGNNFGAKTGDNTVRFGNIQAAVSSASVTQIVTAVPPGLDEGIHPVTVTFGGQTSNPVDFTVTNPIIQVGLTSLNFGVVEVGKRKDLTLNIANFGRGGLIISSLVFSSQDFSFSGRTLPFTIDMTSSADIIVSLTAKAVGPVNGTLTIGSNATNTPQVIIPLTAQAVPAGSPDIAVTPAPLDFGQAMLNVTNAAFLTVSNPGTSKLWLQAVTSGDPHFTIDMADTPLGVEPGQSKRITVNFKPSAPGSYRTTLIFVSNAENRYTFPVATTGYVEGTQPSDMLATDDGTIEFGAYLEGLVIVNRLTPRFYPLTLRTIRIHFIQFQNLPSPAGQQIRLVVMADPSGTGQPPVNGTNLINKLVTIPEVPPGGGFIDFDLQALSDTYSATGVAAPLTIESGDIYVGYQAPRPAAGVGFSADSSGSQQQRAFYSTNDGASYSRLGGIVNQQGNLVPVNIMIQAGMVGVGACIYSVSPSGQSFAGSAGSGLISVTAPSGCNWGASTTSPWIGINAGNAGNGNGTVSFSVTASADPRQGVITVAGKTFLVAQAQGVISVSSASYSRAGLAAEAIAAAFGSSLATSIQAAAALPLPTALAGTTVKVRDLLGTEIYAPLLFVSPEQVNFQMPPGLIPGPVTVTVVNGVGGVSVGTSVNDVVAPGLFAANADGQGVPAAVLLRVRADGSQVYEPVAAYDQTLKRYLALPIDLGPAAEQVYLILYGTGFRYRTSLDAVETLIGGIEAPVQYAGAQGYFAGLDQINMLLPRELAGRGETDIQMSIDGRPANVLRIYVR